MNTQPQARSQDDHDALLSFVDDPDFGDAPWSLEELEHSADLGSVRSAWADSLEH
jgi:hypothetical protein